MSSWIPVLADILVASSAPAKLPLTGLHAKASHPGCYSPEGYGPVSKLRQFDLTPCFEGLIVTPVPLIILIAAGLVDVARIGRKGPSRERAGWSKIRLWLKMVSTDIP